MSTEILRCAICSSILTGKEIGEGCDGYRFPCGTCIKRLIEEINRLKVERDKIDKTLLQIKEITEGIAERQGLCPICFSIGICKCIKNPEKNEMSGKVISS